jgi:hypothetical protein
VIRRALAIATSRPHSLAAAKRRAVGGACARFVEEDGDEDVEILVAPCVAPLTKGSQ